MALHSTMGYLLVRISFSKTQADLLLHSQLCVESKKGAKPIGFAPEIRFSNINLMIRELDQIRFRPVTNLLLDLRKHFGFWVKRL